MEHPLKPLYLLNLFPSKRKLRQDCEVTRRSLPESLNEYLSLTSNREEEDRGFPLTPQTPELYPHCRFRFVRKPEISKLLSSHFIIKLKIPFRPSWTHQTGNCKSCEGTEEQTWTGNHDKSIILCTPFSKNRVTIEN